MPCSQRSTPDATTVGIEVHCTVLRTERGFERSGPRVDWYRHLIGDSNEDDPRPEIKRGDDPGGGDDDDEETETI